MATNILIQSPFEFFTDRTGRALANGRIYIGLPGQDPENFPQAAFFDVGGTTPTTQPIRTNVAGYPSDTTGNPQRIFTTGAYSIRVKDSNGVQVFYAANSTDGFYGVSASDLSNNVNPNLGSGMVGFVLQSGATGTTVHDRLARGWVDIKDFGAVGDGVTNDKAAFDAAAATGRSILLPAGNYNVPSGNYGSSRFYSFDGATTTNGAVAVVDPLANSLAVGTQVDFPCIPSALPFGWLHRNGQTLNRSVYPQLWGFANGSGNIVDEVDKPSNKAAFGRGNGSTTFSLPDDRGVNRGFADAGAGVDATFIIGKQVTVTAASAAPGISVRSSISTPAIRAFAASVNQGSIDIQALQAAVSALQTSTDTGFARTAASCWASFNAIPLSGTYTQAGTLITVTQTAHGMRVGQLVNNSFTTGTAVSGTLPVATVINANSYTLTAAAPVTTSGNVTRNLYVRDSYNVRDITKIATGDYSISFITNMLNIDYSVTAGDEGGAVGNAHNPPAIPLRGLASIRMQTFAVGAYSLADAAFCAIQIIGGR